MSVVEPLARPAAAPPASGLLQATAIAATVGVVIALAGLALLALPVSTPAVDCGTAFSYLYDGRFDQPIDPADPPAGVSKAEAEASNAEPCHDRVVDRARPGGLLIGGGAALAVMAAVTELVVRNLRRRQRPPGAAPTPG